MDWSKSNILVVDDNDMDRYILCRQLNHLNIKNIVQASNQSDALALIESSLSEGKHFAAVLLDFYLGETKGSECAFLIKALFKQKELAAPKIILMSSASGGELVGETSDFDLSISKGIAIEALSEKLKRLLN